LSYNFFQFLLIDPGLAAMVDFPSKPLKSVIGAALGALALTFALAATPADAEPRVALVIGNSAYQAGLPPLPNPANDARLMAKTLKGIGFDVVEAEDANQLTMKKAIADFGNRLTAAGNTATGLFYYAGHGVQVAGVNYLIPVDAQIQKEADVDLAAVQADSVLSQMNFAGAAVNIVILDACRDNPLRAASRGMTRGLAEIKSTPRGTFIAYSTAPGSTAQDGNGADSPYTMALADALTKPGLSIGDVFQDVRTKVLAATGNQQITWDANSLTGQYYFRPAEQVASVTPPTPTPDATNNNGVVASATNAGATDFEKMYWESIQDSNDPADYQAYLNKYPSGHFADLANLRVKKLSGGGDTQVASVTPAPDTSGSTITERSAVADPSTVQPAQTPQMIFVALDETVYARNGGQVRSQPDGRADLLVKMPTNAEVHATGKSADGKWWRVTTADGQTGYMHRTVAAEQPLQLASAAQQQQQQPNAVTPNADAIEMVNGGVSQPSVQQTQPNITINAPNASTGAAQVLAGLAGAASQMFSSGQSGGAQSTAGQMQFAPVNRTILVRGGATILSAAQYGSPAIAVVKTDTQVQAMARTPDARWWQVQLSNGTSGYLEGRFVQQ
jgi:carboxyl-terminal processing protease